MTFDAPYDRVVTELRELYPEYLKGKRAKKERQRWEEYQQSVEHLAWHGAMHIRITREKPSSSGRSVIHLEATAPKFVWKRQADITIRRLSESHTAVTVRCDYLRHRWFGGYSRSRDQRYERERLDEISERLVGQSERPKAPRKKMSAKRK